MTIAGFLARLQRARRQDAPRVLVTLLVFQPDGEMPVALFGLNGTLDI